MSLPADNGKAWYHPKCFTVPPGLNCLESITGYEDLEDDDATLLEGIIGEFQFCFVHQ